MTICLVVKILRAEMNKPTKSIQEAFYNLFEDTQYTENYHTNWLKYPKELFSLINSKVEKSFEALDEGTKKSK